MNALSELENDCSKDGFGHPGCPEEPQVPGTCRELSTPTVPNGTLRSQCRDEGPWQRRCLSLKGLLSCWPGYSAFLRGLDPPQAPEEEVKRPLDQGRKQVERRRQPLGRSESIMCEADPDEAAAWRAPRRQLATPKRIQKAFERSDAARTQGSSRPFGVVSRWEMPA